MNLTVWALVGLVILALGWPACGWLGFHYGRHHERTEGKHRRTAEKLDQQWDEWIAQVRPETPGDAMMSGETPGWPAVRPMKQHRPDHITAADLKHEVVVPEPKLTDTGELRALAERGAAIRTAMVTGEHAWRAKMGL